MVDNKESEPGVGSGQNPGNTVGNPTAGPGKGVLGGVLACLYCLVAGGLGVAGGSYNFFINHTASIVATVYGLVSLILLVLVSRRYSAYLYQVGRNLSIVFALVLVVLFFTNGGQPEVQQILRLVLQLAVVWIVFSTFSHLGKMHRAKGNAN